RSQGDLGPIHQTGPSGRYPHDVHLGKRKLHGVRGEEPGWRQGNLQRNRPSEGL
ncbi:uncharacterized protein METZ01_LOCUS378106, partial [marine metagenome]